MKAAQYGFTLLFCLVLQGHVTAAQNEISKDTSEITKGPAVVREADQSVEEYRTQIKKQETRNGPYDPQLSEQLLGLGLLYKSQEKYQEAAKTLERALHIKRVNDGVDNMSQLPILEALIDVNTAAENWKALDLNYDLLLQVNQRNLAAETPEVIAGIERVGRWKIQAYKNHLLKLKPEILLNHLIDVYRSSIKIIEEQHGKNDPHLIGFLNGLALAHYLLIDDIKNRPLMEFQGDLAKEHMERVCRPIFTREGVIMMCGDELVSNPNYYLSRQTTKTTSLRTQLNIINSSVNRMVKILGANPNLQHQDLAMALVQVGDWYLIYKMQDAAISSYKVAFQLLAVDATGTNGVEKAFGRPVRIPSITDISNDANSQAPEQEQSYVKLSFDVGTDGKADHIKVVEESNNKNFMARKTAKAQVKSWVFRPRFDKGEPVATHGMVMRLTGEDLHTMPAHRSGPAEVTGSRIWR